MGTRSDVWTYVKWKKNLSSQKKKHKKTKTFERIMSCFDRPFPPSCNSNGPLFEPAKPTVAGLRSLADKHRDDDVCEVKKKKFNVWTSALPERDSSATARISKKARQRYIS